MRRQRLGYLFAALLTLLVPSGGAVVQRLEVPPREAREAVVSAFAPEPEVLLSHTEAERAPVASVDETPHLAFRSLSGLAGGGPGENELTTFFELASSNSAALLVSFLTLWGAR